MSGGGGISTYTNKEQKDKMSEKLIDPSNLTLPRPLFLSKNAGRQRDRPQGRATSRPMGDAGVNHTTVS
ncbi:hypothetical protein J6590_086543 [Homalodisca vitripennis]|nr:hypothetical protein J6590_086543 [Homalodisca vitripennis]